MTAKEISDCARLEADIRQYEVTWHRILDENCAGLARPDMTTRGANRRAVVNNNTRQRGRIIVAVEVCPHEDTQNSREMGELVGGTRDGHT